LRYATSAVGALFTKGRKQWSVILFYLSYVRPAFVNSYPGVCERRRDGQTRVRVGDRASLQSALSVCHHAPPPCAATHGDPSGAGAWTDGRATYAAALADRPIPILASIAQYLILITGIVRTLKATASDK